ncbi:two-component system, sensor histidine kinase ChiS [Candidatus Methanophagaceae archaeon]|jgi:CheY-like chemotaxis protein|nr:MAG: Chemotaxis protein CheY [Methanophagales archaeon]KAF5431044.1 two-component system, sensor histidine kinase ChiS [Methanophagales archaeon]KAF5436840.1 two-component system, sensor histidine kinase ChiS [Methanophagales archaeon]
MTETKTVMVVDDEPDVLLSVAQILESNNYRTIKAKDGYECLECLKEVTPDVLLLDIMMPGLTSKEILEMIAKESSLSQVKIIFLTAVHSQEAEEGGLLASRQVVDFIEKPFTVRRMLDAIEKAMKP